MKTQIWNKTAEILPIEYELVLALKSLVLAIEGLRQAFKEMEGKYIPPEKFLTSHDIKEAIEDVLISRSNQTY